MKNRTESSLWLFGQGILVCLFVVPRSGHEYNWRAWTMSLNSKKHNSTASQLHNLLVFQLEQKLKLFNNLVSNLMTCLLDGPKQDVSCLLSGWVFVDFRKIITAFWVKHFLGNSHPDHAHCLKIRVWRNPMCFLHKFKSMLSRGFSWLPSFETPWHVCKGISMNHAHNGV